MILRLVFGDFYCDGHGKWVEKWVSCPDLKCIEAAKDAVKEHYGKNFFKGFANEYEEPYLSYDVCEALEESGYELERVFLLNDARSSDWPEIKTFTDIANAEFCVDITSIVDMYIHLLNYYGAHLIPIGSPFNIIDSEVGYGCFD